MSTVSPRLLDVPETFATALDDHARHTALVDEIGARVSYHELAERADALSERIGATRKLVVLEAANGIASIVALIACLRAGHAVIVGSDAARERIEGGYRPNVRVAADGELTRLHDRAIDLHPDLALMLSTSGSTGATKLVRLSYAALQANAGAIAEYLHIADDDAAITSLPINYSYGLSVVNSHLLRGAALVLTDRSVIEDGFWDLFRRENATSIAGVPYTYELLEATGFRDKAPASLRTMTQAGGRLSPELVKTYHQWSLDRGVSFFTMYGQTEATARMAYLPPEMIDGHSDCIGKAIPGGRLYVAAEEGSRRAAPLGETGELVYVGDNVMMGYATELADLAKPRELDELRTGDIAQEVEPGLFRVVGRSSRFSKIAGLRLSLDEVEAVLARRGVTATVAGDDALVVVAVADAAAIETAHATLTAETGIPARSLVVIAMPELPRLVSGKVDYPAIRKAGHAAFDQAEADAASQATSGGESKIARTYARALNRKSVDPDESFATLAGDSLAYIEVSMAIEQRLGHLPDGWEHLTVAQIDALAADRPDGSHQRRSRSVATEMLLRPLAMTLIITGHFALAMNFDARVWQGGALALLMTAGYNATRFQRDIMVSPGRWKLLGSFALRFLVPYYLLLLFRSMMPWGPIGWRAPLLLNSYAPQSGSAIGRYWFIEALTHLLLITLIVFSIPALRRLAVRHRWWFAVAALAIATGFHVFTPGLLSPEMARLTHRLDTWGYAYFLGWVVADANTTARKVFAIAAAFLLSGFDWGIGDLHNIMLVGAAGLILYLPRVRLWTPLAVFMAFFAQSTFYIYLSHGLTGQAAQHWHVSLLPTVVAAIIVGMIGYVIWRQVELRVVRLIHARGGAAEHRVTDL